MPKGTTHSAFIGVGGPYWTDLDGNHEVTRNVLDDGNGRIDADESAELSDTAVGFEITDLDVGILLMASVNVTDLGLYLAGKLNVHSFGLVGIDGLSATGTFDVALNIGIGFSGLAVVDFVKSFSEANALFDLIDTTNDNVIDQNEQIAAFYAKHGGKTIILARFIPIVRTYAPFVAGASRMDYPRFLSFNIIGGVAWITIFLFAGYFFGNIPAVQKNFEYVVIGIIAVSLIPPVIEWLKHRREQKAAGEPTQAS